MTVLVLAAGEGTRMRSSLAKVLHRIGGRTLVGHVLESARGAGADAIAAVIGPGRSDVAAEIERAAPGTAIFIQHERLGTAHAALAARDALKAGHDMIAVFGDTPLLRPGTLNALRAGLKDAAVVVLGFRPASPHGYGRLIMAGDRLAAIREERDASDAERRIGLCNAGAMAIAGEYALSILSAIGNANAKGEYYLTDAVEVARQRGLAVAVREAPEEEVMGVNDKAQLAQAEAVLQSRLRAQALEQGVTLIAPDTVFLSADTHFGRDVTVEPNVVIGRGVSLGDGVIIKSFSHLEGAEIGSGAVVGPFARLRPGTRLGANTKIGNFVEIKAATFGDGAKANHLSYVGDANVGAEANIGAGTITCNYDGYEKHRTEIGRGAFIGSNSALVAPVKVGDGAYVGTGSVVTENVPDDALALARGRQANKPGWAAKLRERMRRKRKQD
jgi:bifunctional UDP-N-acetylglucosamine pyrophosphorylase/glucosamine-1-phosphate N-acetyltransferase